MSSQDDSNSGDRDDQAPASPDQAGSGAQSSEQFEAGKYLYEAGQQFATRLQLLLTYRREIGTVARATSFANFVSIFSLLSEMVEASRNRVEADALASLSGSSAESVGRIEVLLKEVWVG